MTDVTVKCYGCGMTYEATGLAGRSRESATHCMHTGDTGLSREQLLAWINDLQAERDEWIARAFRVMGTLPGHG